MLNVKKTLKNLHKNLPNLTLDELLTIIDCYCEEYQLESPHFREEDEMPKICYYGNGEKIKGTNLENYYFSRSSDC